METTERLALALRLCERHPKLSGVSDALKRQMKIPPERLTLLGALEHAAEVLRDLESKGTDCSEARKQIRAAAALEQIRSESAMDACARLYEATHA